MGWASCHYLNSLKKYVPRLRSQYGVESLPIDERTALKSAVLPSLHRDPFDRMLVVQAVIAKLTIGSPDHAIAQYAVDVLW